MCGCRRIRQEGFLEEVGAEGREKGILGWEKSRFQDSEAEMWQASAKVGAALLLMSLTHEDGRKRCEKPGGRTWSLGILLASVRQKEEIGPSPCLWDYAGEREHLMWDTKNLVTHEEVFSDGRAFAVLQRTAGAPPLPWGSSRVLLAPEAGWNALGDVPAFQEATGHGGASPELGLWQLPSPSWGQRGLLGVDVESA